MESESLLKVIELLSVQQINTREINDSTENFIAVKETSKNKKTKLNHHQDYRIPLRNSFEILPTEECQDKPEPTDEENTISPSLDHAPGKRRQKKQSTKHNKQPEAYITNAQYEEPLEQKESTVFRDATSKRLNHYILPTLHEDHPDVVLLHIGSNDINNQTKDRINTEKLTGDIINIGKSCIDLGVKEVVKSSILLKRTLH